MSDSGDNVADVAEVQETAAPAGPMDLHQALTIALKKALVVDGVARGLRECAKALDRREAHLCILASNCSEPTFVRLVEALCAEHQIDLLKVDDSKKLGEQVGLCKLDAEGHPRKVVGCSCAVIRDWGEDSEAQHFLLSHFGKK